MRLFSIFFACLLGLSAVRATTPRPAPAAIDSLNALAGAQLDKDPAKALELGTEALERSRRAGYVRGEAVALGHLGKLHETLGDDDKAVAHYFESLKLFERQGDKRGVAGVYNALGVLFRGRENYDKALQYLQDAEKMSREASDGRLLAESYNNLGGVHYFRNDFDTALRYFKLSLQLRQHAGLRAEAAKSQNNVGLVYKRKKDYDKALQYFRQCLNTQRELGNKAGISTVLDNIGDVYLERKDYARAVSYHAEGLGAAQTAGARQRIRESYESLIELYTLTGDYKKALEYKTLHTALKDTLFNEHSARIVAETQARYATEKKEKQIALLQREATIRQLELNRNRLVSYAFLGGGLMVSGLLLVIYRSARQKQQANGLLAAQNAEIRHQHLKITDSIRYAKRIQEALSPEAAGLQERLAGLFVLFKPRDIVSGDFFWHYAEGDLTVLAAVDCTGHGVPGAFMTVLGNTLLNQVVAEGKVFEPHRVLAAMDEKLAAALGHQGTGQQRPSDGMDVALCVIDHRQRTLQFAGAKRPLYFFRDGACREVKGDIFPIGGGTHYKHGKTFQSHTLPLAAGDRFYLFSDGFPDQFGGESDTKFMTKRFRQLLTELHPLPPADQQEGLESELAAWQGNHPQTDDILVVGAAV
ncbi:MAG: tetratricopeptide repeat protein [Cytophagales bacterium]|nr:tetratricopeptide repeat protein [Cytophagales bacterium]